LADLPFHGLEGPDPLPETSRSPYYPVNKRIIKDKVERLQDFSAKASTILIGQNPTSSLVAQSVKSLPSMRETRVQSLAQEDPLEKEMATHSGIFAWRTPWTKEPGGLQSMRLQRVGHD